MISFRFLHDPRSVNASCYPMEGTTMTRSSDAPQASFAPAGDGTGDYIARPAPGPGKTSPSIVAAAALGAREGLIDFPVSCPRSALQELAFPTDPAVVVRVPRRRALGLAIVADQVLSASGTGLLAARETPASESHQLPNEERELVASLVDVILTHSDEPVHWPFTSRPFHPKSWCGGQPPLAGKMGVRNPSR